MDRDLARCLVDLDIANDRGEREHADLGKRPPRCHGTFRIDGLLIVHQAGGADDGASDRPVCAQRFILKAELPVGNADNADLAAGAQG